MNSSIEYWQVPQPPSDDSSASESEESAKDSVSGNTPPVDLLPVCSGYRGLLILLLMILAADICLYRSEGFTGPALFLPVASLLLILGVPSRSMRTATWVLLALVVVVASRLAMNGSGMLLVLLAWLLMALPHCLRGWPPFVLETLVFAAQCVPGGYEFFRTANLRVRRKVLAPIDEGRPGRWLELGLPVGSALVFGTIFLLANPALVKSVSQFVSDLIVDFQVWLRHFSLLEICFWAVVAWITAGVLRPVLPFTTGDAEEAVDRVSTDAAMYRPFAQTLATVIVLFAAYLVFEFYTLSTNVYEKGFGFSDYAHEGAMWLTVALVLATLLLSLIFRGATWADPRVGRLRKLAWIWVALNLVLAIAVYTRLFIYIDYNGMTRMRTVGLLGVTAVVGGFAVMKFKIQLQREFYWLVQRQLWIVGLAVTAYVVLPVDSLCHRYNVSRVIAGDLAPSVQLAVHPIDDEALPVLLPLLECEEEEIRQGVHAMLLDRLRMLKSQQVGHWSAWQYSKNRSLAALAERLELLDVESSLNSDAGRDQARRRFRDYTMEWF